MKKQQYISKTNYVLGTLSPRALWVKFHKSDVVDESTLVDQMKIEEGFLVTEYTYDYYQNGKIVHALEIAKAEKKTQELLNDDSVKYIFEAAFRVQEKGQRDLVVRVDVLEKVAPGVVNIIEAKSSNNAFKSEKKYFLTDIAFQKYVVEKNDLVVNEVSIQHLNPTYTKEEEISLDDLFLVDRIFPSIKGDINSWTSDRGIDIESEKDILKWQKRVSKRQETFNNEYVSIKQNLQDIQKILRKRTEPNEDIKSVSHTLLAPFKKYFNSLHDTHSIEDFVNVHTRKKSFKEQELFNISDFSTEQAQKFLSQKQKIQWESIKRNKVIVNVPKVEEQMNELVFPLFHLDFESINYAVPRHADSSPNQQIVFQASIHKENEKRELEHSEFLDVTGNDPRRELALYLIKNLESVGSVVVYYAPFERTRIEELAELFQDLSEDLLAINERMWDLNEIFKTMAIYHPNFRGKNSIKTVGPIFAPSISYKDMLVNNGEKAQAYYSLLISGELTKKESKKYYDALSAYCTQDTYIMAVVIWKIREIIEESNYMEALDLPCFV
jgi:hypothetical protein